MTPRTTALSAPLRRVSTVISPPLVSVIIPTYNRRQLIGWTVDSVLAQTHAHLEAIVVDDGSTDGTGDYLRQRYAKEPRFRYIWQANGERAVARNAGIRAAQGKYIAFLDSDDLWASNKLERQLEVFAKLPSVVMVHTAYEHFLEGSDRVDAIILDAEHNSFCADLFGALVYGNFIGALTTLIDRRCFDLVGLFNTRRSVLCFEDWEMWTRIAAVGPVAYLCEPLAKRRIHPGNTERPLNAMVYDSIMRGILETIPRSKKGIARKAAAIRFWEFIWQARTRQQNMEAVGLCLRALRRAGPSFFEVRITKELLPPCVRPISLTEHA